MQQIEHFVRFGSHRERKVFDFVNKVKKVNGIAINANVVAHTPSSIYNFLYTNNFQKYFIDPQTYIIQLDPAKYYVNDKNDEPKLKKSVNSLLSEYGNPASNIANTLLPVSADKLDENISEFTKKVIQFQKGYMQKNYSDKKDKKGFSDYDVEISNDLSPEYLIPPYFYLTTEDYEKWLTLNIKFLNEALNGKDDNIAAELVIEKQILLNKNILNEIVEVYKSIDCKTIFLWVDSFDETEVSEKYLNAYVEFVDKLKNNNKKRIINLYGGHFSLLLCKKDVLNGFCHGPGYGEKRAVKPVGGGIPNAKFYLPLLGMRIDFENALRVLIKKGLLNKDYYKLICNCKKCKSLLGNVPNEELFYKYGIYELSKSGKSNIPTEETLTNNQIHYLLKRLDDIDNLNLKKEKEKLENFSNWNKEKKMVSGGHLLNWLNLFKN